MVDLSPRCQPVANTQHPEGQSWCPDFHTLVMVEAPTEHPVSDYQMHQAAALGVAAILIPWAWGRVARLVSSLIESATP